LEHFLVTLNELFDQPYPWRWVEFDPWVARTTTVDDKELVAKFYEASEPGEDHPFFGFEFTVDGKATISNTGDMYRIFSTVISIMQAYISSNPNNDIIFTSNERSRTMLYTRLLTKYGIKFSTEYIGDTAAMFFINS
jgi:hypothetical protein